MNEKRYFVYGRNSCVFCVMACDYLSAQKKEYIFFDHFDDDNFLEELKTFYSSKTVPVILENDLDSGMTKQVGGYTDLLEHMT